MFSNWISYKWCVPVNTCFKEYLISPQFISSANDEAKFRIKICPSGSKNRDYFSLFVISGSKETSFKSKISATILNCNRRKHYGLAANHTFCCDSSPFGWQNFIKINDLMDREQGFINNECIEIWCVIGFSLQPRPRLVFHVQQNDEDISMDCEDCYFEFGNDRFKVIDGNVIANRSEVVKKELCNNNNQLHQMIIKILPSVSLKTFQKLIDYFKGDSNLDGFELEVLINVLIIADALQMTRTL
uniref:MATH domain-containing protein n=1 Tax=Panagrolaimus davidi TaxID=227884 RepID=A0A914QG04_9BILA